MPLHYPIIVVGAGAGGLVIAVGAAKAGKKVLLIEKGTYGGDCTNFGCIPSKSLIAAANVAQTIKTSLNFGIRLPVSSFNTEGVMPRIKQIVDEFRSSEEPPNLTKLDVNTLTGTAQFVGPHTLLVKNQEGDRLEVTGDDIVLATGSHPYIPPIPGLPNTPYLTNETIFKLNNIPDSLIVIGGGPIGCELGQAFQRLGTQVSIIQKNPFLLHKEETEAAKLIARLFENEGIHLTFNQEVREVNYENHRFTVVLDSSYSLSATHLLVASGRRPNIASLHLTAADFDPEDGLVVDEYGRTSQPHIWAVGDVTGNELFTHAAENEARAVLANLVLPWPFGKKIARHLIPRVTFTDPEIAAIGLNEHLAREKYGENKVTSYFVPLSGVDRAVTSGKTEGFVKITTLKWSSKILGATIVAPRAGELISEIALAMSQKVPLRKLAALIHPYPTYSLGIRKAADQWLTQTALPSLKRWFKK